MPSIADALSLQDGDSELGGMEFDSRGRSACGTLAHLFVLFSIHVVEAHVMDSRAPCLCFLFSVKLPLVLPFCACSRFSSSLWLPQELRPSKGERNAIRHELE